MRKSRDAKKLILMLLNIFVLIFRAKNERYVKTNYIIYKVPLKYVQI